MFLHVMDYLYNNKHHISFRIQLKTNRKSLAIFYNTISKTKQYLHHNNKQLNKCLQNIRINNPDTNSSDIGWQLYAMLLYSPTYTPTY